LRHSIGVSRKADIPSKTHTQQQQQSLIDDDDLAIVDLRGIGLSATVGRPWMRIGLSWGNVDVERTVKIWMLSLFLERHILLY
jgi:hypothetical protein